MTLRLYFAALVLLVLLENSYAQVDTLVVRGKIENLTARLYRQAPEVIVARVNILQPNHEIIRVAPLQANGSFELKMPIIFPIEECYLTYSNVVLPFLGSKGTVEITINADSLAKSDLPIRFGGVHAETNNLHARFYPQFKKWQAANPAEKYNDTEAVKYWQHITTQSNRQIEFFQSIPTFKNAPPLLGQWVISSIFNAKKADYYSFLLRTEQRLPTSIGPITLPDSATKNTITNGNLQAIPTTVTLDRSGLLTFSRADFFQQFSKYIYSVTPVPTETSLAVSKVATLILEYIPNLTEAETTKLQEMAQGGTAKTRDLALLNTLFNKKRDTLEIINKYELEKRRFFYLQRGDMLTADYINAIFYEKQRYNSTINTKKLWYQHIRPTLTSPYYRISLDELHKMECADTLAFREAQDLLRAQTPGNYSIDLEGGITLYQKVYMEGQELWAEIKRQMKGKPTYLVFWTNDEYGIRALAEARQLEASLPKGQLNFVYLSEYKDDESIWLENVIKSKCRGLHIKLSQPQNLFLQNEWGITQVPFTVLIDANGKYIKRDAPLPGDRDGWSKIWPRVFR